MTVKSDYSHNHKNNYSYEYTEDDVEKIAKAVKRHLDEENCVHGLRYILREALDGNNFTKRNNMT